MKRKAFLFLLVLILPVVTTGCWSRRELSNLAIVGAIGIDKAGKQYEVTVQVMDPGIVAAKKPSSERPPSVIYHAIGETVPQAIRRMTTVTPRYLYFAHLRMLILGERLAKEGIRNTLDFLSRNNELRTDFYIAVSRGATAREVLGVLTPLEQLPANTMFKSLEVSKETWAPTVHVQLDELMNDLTSDGKQPVLTGIRILGDPEQAANQQSLLRTEVPAGLQYTGLAVFKEDKLQGWLNEKDSKGYNYTKNKVDRTIGVTPCPEGGKISSEVINSETEVKGKVIKGRPIINIHVRIEQNVQDVECKMDLTKKESIADLDQRSNQTVRNIVQDAIKNVQTKYKVDIFGFGEVIRRADPRAWRKLEQNWDRTFTNDLQVHVTTDVKTRRLGTVTNSFLQTEQ
ncbi:Ger(x)C family spore germination protein [Paenibacillus humicola]|uniref:Ger(x)C family spore germination protein n=1 Tax=Paenibacillus humicola TaxID=3110540 RepID=UPI00237C4F1E|nr:Ger(x)C family spore germination protein [Paenibacillus humicola]